MPNWDELPAELRHAINDNLTTLQAQAFVLALYGLSLGQISRAMDITRATAKGHVDAAVRNLRKAGVQFHPDGTPYLKEPA